MQDDEEIESVGKQIKWFVGWIGTKIYCQEIVKIHIGNDPRIPAKGGPKQYNCFFYGVVWIRKTVNLSVQDNSFPDTIRVGIKFAAFYKIPYKISNLKLMVVTR